MTRSWYEVQSLAEKAALGAGVPFSQAARFGVGAARHLSEGRNAESLKELMDAPEQITNLALEVERAVEAASSGAGAYLIKTSDHLLAASLLQSLPCDVLVEPDGAGLSVQVLLDTPQRRTRSARVEVPQDLWVMFEVYAARTYVPESDASRLQGAGASLMQLE